MQKLLAKLQAAYPQLRFTAGTTFVWSPETQEVFYKADASGAKARWSLLHETGHGLLGHQSYKADIELLKLEVAAWDKAIELANAFGLKINEDHVQDCLDTYRDWLYRRSICPTCTTKCLQQSDYRHYRCHNCHTVWKVTTSRFARPYRAVKSTSQSSILFHAADPS